MPATRPRPGTWLAVEGGTGLPVAFEGLRTTLRALRDVAPEAVERHAKQFPAEWNRLFPGSFTGVAELPEIALSPSERRLHRESEQVFRTLLAASRVLVGASTDSGVGVAVLDAGRWDLVSLRGLLFAAERTGASGESSPLRVGGWDAAVPWTLRRFASPRGRHLALARERMGGIGDGGSVEVAGAPARAGHAAEPLDAAALRDSLDPGRRRVERLAAAVAAVRSAFFSTSYEGALLAAEAALDVLEDAAAPSADALAAALEARDDGLASPAMEVDPALLDGTRGLRAFFLKAAGVVHALVAENDLALAEFGAALDAAAEPVLRAQLRMFRALVLSKRLHRPDAACEEIEAGLADAAGRDDAAARRERGWLRNVGGLVQFMGGHLRRALDEERRALEEVGTLKDPSATHLKINLISNISVLQESAKRYEDALRTWRRFTQISDTWNDNFAKHHTYRSAGLQLAAGDTGAAVDGYGQVYTVAGKLGDVYHQHVVACELGTLAYGRSERDVAAERFAQALGHAEDVGDPYWVAQSLVGMALAGAGPGQELLARARGAAAASRTRRDQARALTAAVEAGDPDGLAGLLPAPRSKLNRPFDVVNLP